VWWIEVYRVAIVPIECEEGWIEGRAKETIGDQGRSFKNH